MAKRELKKALKIGRMFKILAYRKKNTDRERPVRQICSGFMCIVIIRMIDTGTVNGWKNFACTAPESVLAASRGFL
ncbi:MAG: hypothetical protein HFI26_13185 [Lachnospiraceae bacterium]|jgi:hypothetical protein|nr:hypothetical protein [Lachnospiraceae bacterium]